MIKRKIIVDAIMAKKEFVAEEILKEVQNENSNITIYDVAYVLFAMCENNILSFKNGKYKNLEYDL